MKKVTLITGASNGIVFETARQLGQQGHTVVLTARNKDSLAHAVAQLKTEGLEVDSFVFEVNDKGQLAELISYITDTYGRLDVLINNAGIQIDLEAFTPGNSTSTISSENLKKTYETNLFAPVLITQKFLPLLKKSEAGRIVNVSSIMGSLALHSDKESPIYAIKLFAYNSSKTALNQFTVHLAQELEGTNVKVNSAHPGWVKTKLGGEYAPLSIEEGAKTLVDLATIGPNGPNGQFIHLNENQPW
ncbi:MAG: SDR family oxidoreductase [Bacteroidota bacterium]